MRVVLVAALVLCFVSAALADGYGDELAAKRKPIVKKEPPKPDWGVDVLNKPPTPITAQIVQVLQRQTRGVSALEESDPGYVDNPAYDPVPEYTQQGLRASLHTNRTITWNKVFLIGPVKHNINQPARTYDTPGTAKYPVFSSPIKVHEDDILYMCGGSANARIQVLDTSWPGLVFDGQVTGIKPCKTEYGPGDWDIRDRNRPQ